MTHEEIIFKNILDRRTVKPDRYTGNTVAEYLIDKILKAAHWAPTHGFTEPWEFVVYTGNGKNILFNFLKEWHEEAGDNEIKINKTKNRIFKASHIISIGMKRGENSKIPEIEELLSVAMAVQNMWLMAHALNLGAYWSTGARAFHPKMRDFLGLEENDKSLGFLYVGEKSGVDLEGHRLSEIEEHVKWVRG